MVKHALNPDKTFMQVHYLKGYFLLRFLASEVGDQQLIDFFRVFVKKYHGQLVLSQDFLQMFLITFPHMERYVSGCDYRIIHELFKDGNYIHLY
ncbi:hypothetical protein XENORESO_009705 [Xenotaenia resolanae]|uniref:Uncharacterized protein n=1 Tax=Xenotaenia resolanae TaxID=208358 RepID=A0ABV0W9I3_9TELE